MTKLDAIALIDLSHCLQRAEALIQVLGEAVTENGNKHHRLMVEIIEEYLLRARKTLGDR
jgi:EAL domain-containing protein (putative c-di-GMP-specific phosphodiesterase class I)